MPRHRQTCLPVGRSAYVVLTISHSSNKLKNWKWSKEVERLTTILCPLEYPKMRKTTYLYILKETLPIFLIGLLTFTMILLMDKILKLIELIVTEESASPRF